MPAVTRNGDISVGICACCCAGCPHIWTSTHFGGSNDVLANGRGVMRLGDLGACTCPHCPISHAAVASPNVLVNGRGAHRLGDLHIVPCGTGNVVSASPNVIING